MSRARRSILAALVGGAVAAATFFASREAEANVTVLQPPRERQGYYQSLGLLLDGVQHWEHGRSRGMYLGNIFTIRFGQMITPRWGLGVWLDFGGAESNGKTRDTAGVGMEGQFNPFSNLALHLGLGLGEANITDPNNLANKLLGAYGSIVSVGASWDLFMTSRLTGGWSVAPTVTVRYLPDDTLRGLWLCAGIQLSHWSGKSRNELILSEGEAYKVDE